MLLSNTLSLYPKPPRSVDILVPKRNLEIIQQRRSGRFRTGSTERSHHAARRHEACPSGSPATQALSRRSSVKHCDPPPSTAFQSRPLGRSIRREILYCRGRPPPLGPPPLRSRSALVEHWSAVVAEPVLHLLRLILRLLTHSGKLVAHLLPQLFQFSKNLLSLGLGRRLQLIHQRFSALLKLLDGRLDIRRGLGGIHVRRPARRRRRYHATWAVRPRLGRRCVRPCQRRIRSMEVSPVCRWGIRPIDVAAPPKVGIAAGSLAKHPTDCARHDKRGYNCNQFLHTDLQRSNTVSGWRLLLMPLV